jgi:radical SAM superfamily enzyme YgiQ (UPF0313 family)
MLRTRALLISTYELGHQPFGLASPAAWLRELGASVNCVDLSRVQLDEHLVRQADFIGFYLPMHTATRIASRLIPKISEVNPRAHLCAYGLYAPLNEQYLRGLGVASIIGGEFEDELRAIVYRLSTSRIGSHANKSTISLQKQRFLIPDRSDLPNLSEYAQLRLADGNRQIVGYTEASRGCKHLCRHCPIVPVYNGVFRIVQKQIVLEDIRRQVTMGAQHITFGDPDFFNGIRHAIYILRAMHCEYPHLTYDVTIKIEHLLRYSEDLITLRDTGCAFVTSAVESVDDRVLETLDKGHTRADFIRIVSLCREVGLTLAPTFVAFTPWLTLESYKDLLETLARLDVVDSVAPIQLSIRLLIPQGSRLLERPEIQQSLGSFDETALSYRWTHPDSRVDTLQRNAESLIRSGIAAQKSRSQIYRDVWTLLHELLGRFPVPTPPIESRPALDTVPYLTEPWFC